MKRRLNIAAALVHDPDVLLLDEPTVGVDPQSRNAIFDNLEALRARGKALLYTTHYMEEAERLCRPHRDHRPRPGRRRRHAGRLYRRCRRRDARARGRRRGRPGRPRARAGPRAADAGRRACLVVHVADLAPPRRAPAGWPRTARCAHRLGRADLEDVFLSLTGRQLRDWHEPPPSRALVSKDLVLYFSNRRALIMSIAAPIAIAAFFGSIFCGGAGDERKPSRIPIAVVDRDAERRRAAPSSRR